MHSKIIQILVQSHELKYLKLSLTNKNQFTMVFLFEFLNLFSVEFSKITKVDVIIFYCHS